MFTSTWVPGFVAFCCFFVYGLVHAHRPSLTWIRRWAWFPFAVAIYTTVELVVVTTFQILFATSGVPSALSPTWLQVLSLRAFTDAADYVRYFLPGATLLVVAWLGKTLILTLVARTLLLHPTNERSIQPTPSLTDEPSTHEPLPHLTP